MGHYFIYGQVLSVREIEFEIASGLPDGLLFDNSFNDNLF